ncbi:unnamed protein product [Miscanthus lutarioriparius]|uniref:F-box domain-containing protein n=1 Tax=Miscanthus lutarioriparius TaxID=422564 RepID=A0A811Q7B5_9POAL|nr:unnamed protein product [Miscanthus lutarioriparius]
MADDDLATQGATSPGGGASRTGRTPRRVVDRLPAEQGERIAALVRELRGGRNHVAVDASAASYAGLDSGTAAHDAVVRTPVEFSSVADPGVSSSAGKAHDVPAVGSEKQREDDNGTAAHDAVVGVPVAIISAAAPGVASSAGKVSSTVAVSLATQSTTAQGAGASGRICTLADLPDSGLRRVADLLPAEEGERFAALFRELRGGPNHVAVEFSAAAYAGLYNGTADHDAVVGIPAELSSASAPVVPSSAGTVYYTVAQDGPGSKSKEGEEEEGEGDGIDRLTDLPNDVLSDIVGRLPLVEAVRTRVLSRRWLILPTWRPRQSLAAALFADTENADSDGDEDAITSGVALHQADRFSELPDHVICSILCRVPLVEAIRTCVLGRRWREVWTWLPCLNFDDMAVGDAGVTSFLNFVDEVLARCSDMKVQRFMLRVTNPDNVDGARLAAWSAHAAERVSGRVMFKLDLGADFLQGETVFEMPNQALADSFSVSISHPEEIAFMVRLTANGQFALLTRLVLVGTRFRADGGRSISDVVSHDCPLLNSLRLEDVRGVFWLRLSSSSLIELTAMFVSDLTEVKLETPKLNHVHFAYSFVGKEATTLSVFKHQLTEVVWNDTWPVHSDLGTAVSLEKLTVHRQNNSQNLKRIISQFRLRSVKTLCVSVSTDEVLEAESAKAGTDHTPRAFDTSGHAAVLPAVGHEAIKNEGEPVDGGGRKADGTAHGGAGLRRNSASIIPMAAARSPSSMSPAGGCVP